MLGGRYYPMGIFTPVYPIGFSAVNTRKKVKTDNVLNFWNCLRFLITLYVLTLTKFTTKYIILWKVIITSFKIISILFYLFIFQKTKTKKKKPKKKKKKLQGTKYGDQNVNFCNVTPYMICTHSVFLRLY